MKIPSLQAFKEKEKCVIPQKLLHSISGGTETSSSASEETDTDPIPPATTHKDPPPPPPPKETTIYRIDADFVYT